MKRLLFILFFTAVVIQLSAAGPIRISVKDTTVLRGTTFLYAISVDSSLSGLNVTSYEIELNFDPNAVRIENVISSGTLTANWGTPMFNVVGGRITIAGAGAEPLSNTGALIYLRISAALNLPHNGTGMLFTKAMLNEGNPATIVRNGTINIQPLPIITVNPDVALLTVGDSNQFSVFGGVAPFIWSVTNPSIATIDSNGLLKAIRHGYCRVIARDQNGTIDTSGQIEIRAFKLTIRDTTFIQGRSFLIPVYITPLDSVDITSGQFSVSFNPDLVTINGTTEIKSLLQQYGPTTFQVTPGKITLSFAGVSRLSGVGTQILVFLNCRASTVNIGGTALTISDLVFNENLLGNIRNGDITIQNRSILSVNPQTATLVAGDSLQFIATGTIHPPITWMVSDTSKADMSNTGLLKVKRSGIIKVSIEDSVGAIGTTGVITLYDIRVRVQDDSAGVGGWAHVGLHIERYPSGIGSAQLKLNFDPNYLEPLAVITAGTLSSGWSATGFMASPGSYSVAAAGSNNINVAGTLLKVRFKVLPTTPFGSYYVNLSDVVFNEGIPLGLTLNGSVVVDGRTDVGNIPDVVPTEYLLGQNYPNPFNPSTFIKYQLPVESHVIIKIYNMFGQEIRTLIDEIEDPGYKSREFIAITDDNTPLASGVYFYRFEARSITDLKQNFTAVGKMLLLR